MGRIFGIVFLVVLVFPFAAWAQTDSSWYNFPDSEEFIENMDTDELLNTYEAANLFHSLDSAASTFDQDQYCGEHLKKADDTALELEELNQIRNKTTSSYGIRAAEVKEANNQAIEDYESCYDGMLPGFPLIKKEAIFTYSAFTAKYDEMVGDYEKIADLDTYLIRMKAEIDKRTNGEEIGDIVATVKRTYGQVTVIPSGIIQVNKKTRATFDKKQKSVHNGYKLREGDILETGKGSAVPWGRYGFSHIAEDAGSGVVIVFEYDDGEKVTVILGQETKIKIGQFDPKAFNQKKARIEEIENRSTAVEIMYGIAFISKVTAVGIKNAGVAMAEDAAALATGKPLKDRRTFSTRTGTSLCGIRGTEMVIGHNAVTGESVYHLDHGDAFVEAGGQRVSLIPLTSTSVVNNGIGTPQPIPASEFQTLRSKINKNGTIVKSQEAAQIPPKTDAILSRPARTQSSVFSQSNANNANVLTANLLSALRDANTDEVFGSTSGDYHSRLNDRKNQTGDLRGYLQKSKQRPVSFTVGCTVCSGSSGDCWTYADISTVSKPDANVRVIFESERTGGKAAILTTRNWNSGNEKLFHSKGQAYCD